MIIPPFLKKGDAVGIVSPAKYIDERYLLKAREVFERKGYKVVIGEHAAGKFHRFSGTDDERLADMQRFLDDREIKAVLCARGGYGAVRIIDRLDFSAFRKNPKWIIGFSDITVFHSHLNGVYDTASLHATVPLYFPESEPSSAAVESLFDALEGEALHYKLNPVSHNRIGRAKGEVTGGNLSIVTSLCGTDSDIDTRGRILFLEEVAEYDYRIDRMLYTLKKSGKLNGLAGLILGRFKDIKTGPDPMGKSVEQLITDAVAEYDYPVCFGFPAGHIPDNMAIPQGEVATLDIETDKCYISFDYGRSQRTGEKR